MHHDLHARFVELHAGDAPLLLPNAWDAGSARLFEDAGASAIATSSAAVAWSRGYPDGNALPRTDLLDAVRGITRVCTVPVSIDVEAGYSDDPREVAALVAEVVAAGAVGINIEDGLQPPTLLAGKIHAIRATLGATPCFINARTDVLREGLAQGPAAVAMVIERMRGYAAAGADGAFVPGLASARDAQEVAAAMPLVLNVMALPGLPPVADLRRAGVRRISSAAAPYKMALVNAREAVRAFIGGDVAPMFAVTLDYEATNRMFASIADAGRGSTAD